MSLQRHLRVIGSESIFRFFLPPDSGIFGSTEFLCVEPVKAESVFSATPIDGSVTVLVNPDDYEVSHLALLGGVNYFWFVRPLALSERERFEAAPRLLSKLIREIQKRADFLTALEPTEASTIVVSDSASFDFCATLGHKVVISPPPVGDVRVSPDLGNSQPSFGVWAGTCSGFTELMDAVGSMRGLELVELDSRDGLLKGVSHSILLHTAVSSGFPYEAALSLVSGQTLISTHVNPLWGLEPGIDFFEVSTPEELHYLIRSILRAPNSTRLMSFRGTAKAGVFDAETVFRVLLTEKRPEIVGTSVEERGIPRG